MTSSHGQRTDPQQVAYECLAKYFQEHENETIEIEILSPAIQPPDGILMQDGLSLGVPKKILVLAYLEARQRFFENNQGADPLVESGTLQATKIMLLFDPEHITPANFRKRVLSQLETDHGYQNGTPYHKALKRELCFLNSILTSPLHRQSKSPTLWYHRSKVIDSLVAIELQSTSNDHRSAFWLRELDAVCKSGEQHPKNYHAWQYARKLIQKIEAPDIHEEYAHRVRTWCCRHPSDISGWSFLMYLLSRIDSLSLRQELVQEVVKYAIALRSGHESLWVFIRTILAQDMPHGEHFVSYQLLQAYTKDLGVTETSNITPGSATAALKWIGTYASLVA
ncbi:prenyltransferase [Pyrenophora seminiperda CCB06]|uniref:Prenyltransferase n=1 Tax=Pyrenophora seminiperda CCB06 TaxID=1302712 RepID=A0A3M7M502_9PLEO|nr:prenyltransferase [Pyrenophora seminiperda CCB06]